MSVFGVTNRLSRGNRLLPEVLTLILSQNPNGSQDSGCLCIQLFRAACVYFGKQGGTAVIVCTCRHCLKYDFAISEVPLS